VKETARLARIEGGRHLGRKPYRFGDGEQGGLRAALAKGAGIAGRGSEVRPTAYNPASPQAILKEADDGRSSGGLHHGGITGDTVGNVRGGMEVKEMSKPWEMDEEEWGALWERYKAEGGKTVTPEELERWRVYLLRGIVLKVREWLEGECEHYEVKPGVPRRWCPLCWDEFVAGTEKGGK